MQRGRDCAEGGRVYSVTRPLELNALKAVRHLVHLEENHHRHPAESLVAQNDIGVAIAKVQCLGQPSRSVPNWASSSVDDSSQWVSRNTSSIPSAAIAGIARATTTATAAHAKRTLNRIKRKPGKR
jgi:hypothetical protein